MKNIERFTLLFLPIFLALILFLSWTMLSAQAEPNALEISISKNPATQVILSGETAYFTVTVTNTGSVKLANIVVTDTLAPECNFSMDSMSPGSGSSIFCSLANPPATFTNTVVVTAEDFDSPENKISNSAESVVIILDKKLFLPSVIK